MRETVNFNNTERGIFSHALQILETQINNKTIYFCVYIYSNITYYEGYGYMIDMGNAFMIKNFLLILLI